MRKAALLLPVCLLLAGCIIFDKKSEAVTFHQLVAPAAGPTRSCCARSLMVRATRSIRV